jgi:tRNA A37 threonylcarbamoyladenosine biosynthesis protein TsaE
LDLDSIIIDDIEDIELFYSEDVIKSVNKTIKCLKKQNSGLSIIRGEVGTGKTSLAKYIAQQLDEITIFIPINFIEQSINNPDFRNFLKKYKKVLIVIDDCDFFSFLGKNNYLASNIIQLVDGVLSDLISVHVLLVFNIDSDCEIEEIYEDCNCLIDIIEVNYLDGDKSTDLSRHLNHNKKYKSDTKLVDIVKNKKSKNKNLLGLK